jgi:hypothetical protein
VTAESSHASWHVLSRNAKNQSPVYQSRDQMIYIRPLRRHNSLHPITARLIASHGTEPQVTHSFSRPTSLILHYYYSREENPLSIPSCAHSSHESPPMIAYTSSQLETDHPSYAIHSSHDSLPFHPGRSTRSSLYITYTRLLSPWTFLRVQLPAEQSILVLLPRKRVLAVALSASKPVSPEAPINATRNKTATLRPTDAVRV